MGIRIVRPSLAGIALLLAAATATATPEMSDGDTTPPLPKAEQTTGRALYLHYCASCHGTHGRGDGPVAAALGKPPIDLTQLAAEHGGTFPYEAVVDAIDGTRSPHSHGVSDMPVWGEVFRGPPGWSLEEQLTEAGKILLIADYLRALQSTRLPVH
jgi:mono/diheme cytochrome c family protein